MDADLCESIAGCCRRTGFCDPSAKIAESSRLSGGCISQAAAFRFEDGSRVFAKWNRAAMETSFQQEATSLKDLREAGAIRVPQVIGVQRTAGGDRVCLVLEYIEPGSKGKDFDRRFGEDLAALHRAAVGPQYGYRFDNVLGSTPQPNPPSDDWIEFFRSQRLQHQLQLAENRGLLSREQQRQADALSGRLDELLLRDSPPTLIHGDLWSGNILCDAAGLPVIIDPAAYYADREAELGMLQWMGGCSDDFWAAYDQAYPLAAGWKRRVEVYRLYHELNHLNLFGGGYAGSVASTLATLSS